jgi:hypothetical protein
MSGPINSRVKTTSIKEGTVVLHLINEDGTRSKDTIQVPTTPEFHISREMYILFTESTDQAYKAANAYRGSELVGSVKKMEIHLKGDNEFHVRYSTLEGTDISHILRGNLFIRAAYNIMGAALTPQEADTVNVRLRDYTNSGRKKKDVPEQVKNYLKPVHLSKALANMTPTLFDIDTDTGGIEASGELIGGVIGKLTPVKWKMIYALMDLLNSTSQTKDKKAADYFMGNAGEGGVANLGSSPRGPQVIVKTPAIRVTKYELARAYKGGGGGTPSGPDIKKAWAILQDLDKDLYMVQFNFTHDGEPYEFRKRVKLIDLTEFRKKSKKDPKETLYIELNAVFRHQIAQYSIRYPHDLLRRTMEAHSRAMNKKKTSAEIPEHVFLLMEYLFQQIGWKGRANNSITFSKLVQMVAGKHLHQKKTTRAIEYTMDAIRTMEHMGIIHGYRIEKSKVTGEDVVIFDLNKSWPDEDPRMVEALEVEVVNGAE